jgi:serine/threonine protein kinase
LGSLRYMAPEQRLGRAEAASDLYALGLVLYEAAAGALPADRALPRSTPRRVRRALEALLKESPRARPVSATAAAELLEASSLPRVVAVGASVTLLGLAAASLWPGPPPRGVEKQPVALVDAARAAAEGTGPFDAGAQEAAPPDAGAAEAAQLPALVDAQPVRAPPLLEAPPPKPLLGKPMVKQPLTTKPLSKPPSKAIAPEDRQALEAALDAQARGGLDAPGTKAAVPNAGKKLKLSKKPAPLQQQPTDGETAKQ